MNNETTDGRANEPCISLLGGPHLCGTCRYEFATCEARDIVWGIDRDPSARAADGDKVLECDVFSPNPLEGLTQNGKDTNMNSLMWWGYLHQNGTTQLKRWFGDPADYTSDCEGNEFVQRIVPPFKAESQEEARRILEKRLLPK